MTRVQYTLDMLLRHQADIYQVGLRYPRFMRYWLARLTYEQSAQTDRMVEALKK